MEDTAAKALPTTNTVITEDGVTTHYNVKARDYKRQGVACEGETRTGHHVEVKPGEYVRLFGTEKRYRYLKVHNHDGSSSGRRIEYDHHYDQTFRIGDKAEYDSYNLHYIGTVVSIGAKTIGIRTDDFSTRVKRLGLHEFSWRNDDFDLDKLRARNNDTHQYI